MSCAESEVHARREIINPTEHRCHICVLSPCKNWRASGIASERIPELAMVVLPEICSCQRKPVAEPVTCLYRNLVKRVIGKRTFGAAKFPCDEQSLPVICC